MRVIINICAIILSLFAIVVHAGAVIDYNNVEEVARGSPDTWKEYFFTERPIGIILPSTIFPSWKEKMQGKLMFFLEIDPLTCTELKHLFFWLYFCIEIAQRFRVFNVLYKNKK